MANGKALASEAVVNHDMAEVYRQGCCVRPTGAMLTEAVVCTRRARTGERGSGHV
jgi:hypothetical protein